MTKPLACIIAGSRDATYEQTMAVIESCPFKDAITAVISGKCKGADTNGEFWAAIRNVMVLNFPADWNKHGKAAGPIRNSEMAKEADAAIIVPRPDGTYGNGSLDMMKKMIAKLGPEQAKFLIWPIPPDELLAG